MSATDELRRMLDERGVEYKDRDMFGKRVFHWGEPLHGAMFTDAGDWTELVVENATPEQAIAATLGTWTCELDDFADVPFSVDYEIEGYDMDSGMDYATLAECSACGAYIIVPPEYHHVLTCDGDEVYQPYRFCPNCGRRVVEG